MCTGSGLVTQNSGELTPVRSCIPITHEVASHIPDTQPKTDATINEQSYSDVVALRPHSPQKVKETMRSPAGTPGQDELSCALKTQPAMWKPDSGSPNESSSDELLLIPQKAGDNQSGLQLSISARIVLVPYIGFQLKKSPLKKKLLPQYLLPNNSKL